MSEDLKIPDFKNETEEAQWWDSHQNDIASAFEQAAAKGTLGHGTVKRKEATPSTSIRLDQEDISRARVLADRKGLRYQTYLKMLIREALIAEEKKLAG
ncbi:MAG: CopG family antitoxin [Candidatus Korobacteraceae bacterium]|jgi:predicted DNA binding CopG/RHH family protein